jgi:hypothetical protein
MMTVRGDTGRPASGESSSLVIGKRQLILALQFLTGSLVTFGGTAFALLAVNQLGTALGSIHLLIGLTGLSVGIFALRRHSLPRKLLLAANALTIVYSISSVSAAGILSLLPSSAFHDSLIGTAAAVIMSSIIIYLLLRR